MNSKKIFSILLLLFGEVLIIIGFLYFGKNLDPKILGLNIVVSTIIYALLFVDVLFPWVDFKDKSHKTIGSLGLRWVFTFFYMLLAISLMLVFNIVKPIDVYAQMIIQAVVFFLLLLGLYSAISSFQKVEDIFVEEKEMRNYVDEMMRLTKEVQQKIDRLDNVPENINSMVSSLQESLRFISPSNNNEAHEIEANYLVEMKAVYDCLFDTPLNHEKIVEKIQKCERTYKSRKEIYSN